MHVGSWNYVWIACNDVNQQLLDFSNLIFWYLALIGWKICASSTVVGMAYLLYSGLLNLFKELFSKFW